MFDLPFWAKGLLGVLLVCAAGVAVWAGPLLLKSAWEDFNRPPPQITFRKVAFFWIKVDHEIYQLGAVIRLQNVGDAAYLVNGIGLDATSPRFGGRGSAYLRQIWVTDNKAELLDDNFLKPAHEATFKFLLPIKLEATVLGAPLSIDFVGQWAILLQKGSLSTKPEFSGTFERIISQADWQRIGRAGSEIDVDAVHFVRTPAELPPNQPIHDTFLFNTDRSARFEANGYSRTQHVAGPTGVITLVRGPGSPPLAGGWQVWGHSYEELWSDPARRAAYDALVPPQPNGEPTQFAHFM